MRRRFWILLPLALSGCTTAAWYEQQSLRHQARAEELSQLGDGWGAAREKDQAVADREEALRRFANRGFWETEILME